MKRMSWVLLIASAFLYALPFWLSDYVWWVIFLFPIPLFYVFLTERVSFVHGYVWGLFQYALHLSGVLAGIWCMASGSYWLRIIPVVFIVLQQSLQAGIWFWAIGWAQKKWQQKHVYIYTAFLVISMWLYFLSVAHLCLTIFGRVEGYALMHPILPLAAYPRLLYVLPVLGKQFLSICLYAWGCIAALVLVQPQNKKLHAMLVIFLLPWVLSVALSYTCSAHRPTWLSRVVRLTKVFPKADNVSMIARFIKEEVRQLLERHPEADIVIMPESSVYSPHVFSTPAVATMFAQEHVGKPIDFIVGSFYTDGDDCRNSCYLVQNGTVRERFDKRHAMVLTERIPGLVNFDFLKDMYFCSIPQIIPSSNARPCLELLNGPKVVPYICSELFFNEWPENDDYSEPIILISNDGWCPVRYVHKLMYLTARLKAIQWQRDILYISFTHAALLTQCGEEYSL